MGSAQEHQRQDGDHDDEHDDDAQLDEVIVFSPAHQRGQVAHASLMAEPSSMPASVPARPPATIRR